MAQEENKSEYKGQLEKDFYLAAEVQEIMGLPAWRFIEESYLNLIKGLDTIRGVSVKQLGVEEIMARQLAIGLLEKWWADLNSIDLATIKQKIENLDKKPDIIKMHP